MPGNKIVYMEKTNTWRSMMSTSCYGLCSEK